MTEPISSNQSKSPQTAPSTGLKSPTPTPAPASAKASAFIHTMRMDSAAPPSARPQPTTSSFKPGTSSATPVTTAPTNTKSIPQTQAATNSAPAPAIPKAMGPAYAEPREIPSSKDDFVRQVPSPSTKNAGLSDTTLVIDNTAEWPTYGFSSSTLTSTPTPTPSPVPNTKPYTPTTPKSISSPEPAKPLIPPLVPKKPGISVMPAMGAAGNMNSLTPPRPPQPQQAIPHPAPATTPPSAPVQVKTAINPTQSQTTTSPFQSGIDGRIQSKIVTPPQTPPYQTGTIAPSAVSQESVKRPQNTVKTFSDDVAAQVKKGMSLSDIAMAEAKRRHDIGTDMPLSDENAARNLFKKRLVFSIGGLLLLIGGAGALWIGYKRFIDVPVVAPVKVIVPPIVKSDTSENVLLESIRPEDASATMRSAVERATMPIGNIKELPLYASPTLIGRAPDYALAEDGSVTNVNTNPNNLPVKLTGPEALSLLSKTINPSLIRAVQDEWYFGVYNNIGNNPIMIFRTNTPEIVYRDMLAWEKSQNIVKELQNIFLNTEERLKPPFFMNTESGASYEFKDAIIDNRDIRVLVNTNGDIVLMYGFLDNNTLIITTNKLALREAYNRIVLGKLVR